MHPPHRVVIRIKGVNARKCLEQHLAIVSPQQLQPSVSPDFCGFALSSAPNAFSCNCSSFCLLVQISNPNLLSDKIPWLAHVGLTIFYHTSPCHLPWTCHYCIVIVCYCLALSFLRTRSLCLLHSVFIQALPMEGSQSMFVEWIDEWIN